MDKAKIKLLFRWTAIGIIGIGLGFMAYNAFVPQENEDLKKSPAQGQRKQALQVRTQVMQPRKLTDAMTISGSLLPNEEVNLSFETSGKITDIYFQEGQRAHKGQLLAKLNDATLQANLRRLQAQQQLTEDRLRRQRILLEKEAVSKEAFQEAEAALLSLRAEIEQVQAQIAQTELRAPFDGTIGLRKVSVGKYVSPSEAIAALTATDVLKIEFAVPERYAGNLHAGDTLSFIVEGDLEKRLAKIYATDSRVNTDTRTYTVRALYNNANRSLMSGRYVQVTLTTQHFNNTLAVPSEAIISEMGIDKVFLYRSGTAQPVEIKKGLRTDKEVQIISGLEVGDTVITSGTMQLRMGMKVEIAN